MKNLATLLEDYLQMRRTLGASIKQTQWLLGQFLAYAREHNATLISASLALQWAIEPQNVQPSYHARRLAEVRRFARYAHTEDPRHEMIPEKILSYRKHRTAPYIYTDDQIVDLIKAAWQLDGQIRPLTYATIVGLLSVSGMRTSEVISLHRNDVDLLTGFIAIRNSKYGKSRLVLCHDSTCQALRDYADRRDQIVPCLQSETFFVSDHGQSISPKTLQQVFVKLRCMSNLQYPTDSRAPRLMDMRHTFAVRTVTQWYRDGIDVECWLPRLSTWLGHDLISDTYWYLSAVPELMALAAHTIERTQGRLQS